MDVGERHVRVSVGFRDFCVSVKVTPNTVLISIYQNI